MNSITALTKLIRSISDTDVNDADDDELAALALQIPKLGRRIQKSLEQRGLLIVDRPTTMADLLGR